MRIVKLLLGTENRGKQKELQALLAHSQLQIMTPEDLGFALQVEETGSSYAANARLKAVIYAQRSGLWTVADDTGLEVGALGGAPGIRSARLAGSDAERRRELLRRLEPHPTPWAARFRATVALANPQGEVDLATGDCPGQIIPHARGEGGFGYDPIFLLEGAELTMAELSLEQKNRLSHRANAVRALLPRLRERLQIG